MKTKLLMDVSNQNILLRNNLLLGVILQNAHFKHVFSKTYYFRRSRKCLEFHILKINSIKGSIQNYFIQLTLDVYNFPFWIFFRSNVYYRMVEHCRGPWPIICLEFLQNSISGIVNGVYKLKALCHFSEMMTH